MTGRAGTEIGMRGPMGDEMTGLGDMDGMQEMHGMAGTVEMGGMAIGVRLRPGIKDLLDRDRGTGRDRLRAVRGVCRRV